MTRGRSQDMIFVIEEKIDSSLSHWSREGDDLIYNFNLPLVEALTGSQTGTNLRTIDHLDGRPIKFNVPFPPPNLGGAPIKDGQELKMLGEGMVINKKGSSIKGKGDLRIRFKIVYPDKISGEQMLGLRQILG